jgi:hypothetical protein
MIMTDRERILINIASMLAQELCTLQLLPAVREYMRNPSALHRIQVESGFLGKTVLRKGDLVLCQTSVGRQQNPYIVSFVADGPVLRAIGTDATSYYGNESFARITGIPECLLWEGDKQRFAEKLAKVVGTLDTFIHRYRGLSFPDDGIAHVTFGEMFGGLSKPTKPYTLHVDYTPKTGSMHFTQPD